MWIDTADLDANFFAPIQHLVIHVSGVVQGVGFRPFIYRLAHEHMLTGSVRNNHGGVVIDVQGKPADLRQFLIELRTRAPEVSNITRVDLTTLPVVELTGFSILASDTGAPRLTPVSADLAICDDCRRELLDPSDRRYRYPFINCTNCGPRFTIIRGVPYDRPCTTMAHFEMCDECTSEYHDPSSRRFHAQPNACPRCGPQLSLLQKSTDGWHRGAVGDGALREIVATLQSGGIALIKGIGGYHLACDAGNDAAVAELRKRKNREEKPFAVMFPSLAAIRQCCDVSEVESDLLTSVSAPIVLLRNVRSQNISEAVAPRNPLLGCLLPYSPLHLLLLRDFGRSLVMTSANDSDEPICFEDEDALARAGKQADVVLIHDRDIHMFADDSVARVVNARPRVWRRARGYIPSSIRVPGTASIPVLAFGGELKNTFCLLRDSSAILSQHIGDMQTERSAFAYERALDLYLDLFGSTTGVAACDLHPDYATTRMAEEWSAKHDVPLERVQHHHAHLAACLAENGHSGQAIGLCLDGTGYGPDGTIWGGEVLLGDFRAFERVGHLETVAMPGGELAARHPWRMALAWLHKAFGDALFTCDLPLLHQLRDEFGETKLRQLLNPDVMTHVYPQTSSAGRLFDAVAALCCFGTRRQYEGQAAMELEAQIIPDSGSGYTFESRNDDGTHILSPVPMFEELTDDLQKGVDPGVMAYRFHEGLTQGFLSICKMVAEERRVNTIALSGGSFQNTFLLTQSELRLRQLGFDVLTHSQVPANDGGIALGQACIASARSES